MLFRHGRVAAAVVCKHTLTHPPQCSRHGCWGCRANDSDPSCCSGRGRCAVGICLCDRGAFGIDCAHGGGGGELKRVGGGGQQASGGGGERVSGGGGDGEPAGKVGGGGERARSGGQNGAGTEQGGAGWLRIFVHDLPMGSQESPCRSGRVAVASPRCTRCRCM